jgi:Zn-finger protein
MTKGYQQIIVGEWIEPTHGEFIDQCCDCCLVHVYKFAVIDKGTREPVTGVQVQFKVRVDRRRTAASRRKLKFSKEKDE